MALGSDKQPLSKTKYPRRSAYSTEQVKSSKYGLVNRLTPVLWAVATFMSLVSTRGFQSDAILRPQSSPDWDRDWQLKSNIIGHNVLLNNSLIRWPGGVDWIHVLFKEGRNQIYENLISEQARPERFCRYKRKNRTSSLHHMSQANSSHSGGDAGSLSHGVGRAEETPHILLGCYRFGM